MAMHKGLIAIIALASIAAGALALRQDAPWVLRNVSPSSPLGLYLYDGGKPGIGDYLAFHPHGPGFERVTEQTGLPMPDMPLLKSIIAGPGDRVCYQPDTDMFQVNQDPPFGIQDRVYQGNEIPLWKGCRNLLTGDRSEYFVHSGRIPNSLDSRFYGPVQASTIVGVYKPLWIEQAGGDDPKTPKSQGSL